jgi:metal-sulfur cluster biosynthetic enzyme
VYKKTTTAKRLVFLVKLATHTRMISKESVLQALSHVEDPDLKKDLVTQGMIQDIQIE